jgi:hypothetical protein
MGTGSFPGVKLPGRGADHPPLSSAEVTKGYSYTSRLVRAATEQLYLKRPITNYNALQQIRYLDKK